MAKVVVFGAANVDIGGFPDRALTAGDSNPGRVRLSMGGVGRNIACNAAALGLDVELVTALGGDTHGALLKEDCARFGVGLDCALTFPDEATSTYLFISDPRGDMVLAINDMAVQDRLRPEALEPALPLLEHCDVVAMDANLPEETIQYIARHTQAPLVADPVSAAKALRMKAALPFIDRLKPNRLEAEALTGIVIRSKDHALTAAEALVNQGVRQVYLTLSGNGLCYADRNGARFVNGGASDIVNATGAGDAFSAALIWSAALGLSIEESARAGLAAGAIAVASRETVDPEMSETRLLKAMRALGPLG